MWSWWRGSAGDGRPLRRRLELRLPSQQIGLQRAHRDREQDADEHHDEDGHHHLAGIGARLRRNEQVYATIAGDVLASRLPADVTEAELMRRYDVTRAELQRLLDRIAAEGWIARLPGYGWRFAETVSSPEAQAQAKAFRAVIEPAAIAQPGFTLSQDVIVRLRERQRRVFEGELDKMTIGEIFQSGCEYHEEIIRGAGNPFFLEALKRVNSIRRLFAYRSFTDREGMRRHVREHLRLLDVLETQRYAEAADLMARHLQRPLVAGLS